MIEKITRPSKGSLSPGRPENLRVIPVLNPSNAVLEGVSPGRSGSETELLSALHSSPSLAQCV